MLRVVTFVVSFMLIFGINMYVSAEITEDMVVAAWLFDGDAKDVSGNGFDGEQQGGKYVDGQIGKSIELNGSSEWVTISKRMGSFQEVTFAHWVKCTGRDGAWRTFCNNAGWKSGDIHYQLHTNNKVEFSINGNPGGNDSFANFAVTGDELNKWIHIATAYSATEKKIRFYINGKLDNELDWGGNPGVLDPGKIGSWDNQRHWQGMIDEFIILNTVASEGDIKSLMDDGYETSLAVDPKEKIAVTWGSLKR